MPSTNTIQNETWRTAKGHHDRQVSRPLNKHHCDMAAAAAVVALNRPVIADCMGHPSQRTSETELEQDSPIVHTILSAAFERKGPSFSVDYTDLVLNSVSADHHEHTDLAPLPGCTGPVVVADFYKKGPRC
jgi:hypothetical protein